MAEFLNARENAIIVYNSVMRKVRLASLILRLGLAVVFLYPAIAAFIDPNSWIGFLPIFLRRIIPEKTLLLLFSLYEIVLASWLLSGKKVFYAAVISAMTLFAIIITNIGVMDIIFRDVAILAAALALATLSRIREER